MHKLWIRWRLALALSATAGLLLAGCGEDTNEHFGAAAPPLGSAALLQPGPHGVGVTTKTFVDTSRSTPANGSYSGASSRTLLTEIWYPAAPSPSATPTDVRDAPVAPSGKPYPLVVYSHGFMSNRTGGAYLAEHLASYGYVVAAPDFPLSNSGAPGGPTVLDLANQPGDVSFVIDQLLAMSADTRSPFAGAVDATRIGVTGLSLGGSTTLLVAFHPTLRDKRIRAAAPQAAGACFLGPSFFASADVPLMLIQGDIDAIVPYQQNAVFAFGEAEPPKYLVTLINGTHTAFTQGADLIFENTPNSDTIGCSALSSLSSGDASFLDLLGGPADGIIMGDCPLPCTNARNLPRAMRPSRQHQLTILSIFPFFEAYLRGNAAALQFITQTLAGQNSDLTVRFQR
jgi:predicted dienelactone hydrolase